MAPARRGRRSRHGPLLAGALISHRRAADSGKETAPALLALAITIAYLAIALIS